MIEIGKPIQVDVRGKTQNKIYKSPLVKKVKGLKGIIKNRIQCAITSGTSMIQP